MNQYKKGRGPGSYASHACGSCRMRKRKCDGVEPICGSCERRGDQCVWGSQEFKKPASKELVESLRNRVQAVEQENMLLRDRLARCTCSIDETVPSSSNNALDESVIYSNSTLPDSPEIEELSLSTKRLVLEQDNLTLYGPTSAFGLNPTEDANVTVSSLSQPNETQGTYVLYAENDGIDWDRYLPETSLTRKEHDRLLEILFKYSVSWSMSLAPRMFFRDMHHTLSSSHPVATEHYSPMLHNSLLSFICGFSDDPVLRDIKTRRQFVSKAKSFLDSECQKPSISTAQALYTIGSFHSTCSEQTLGYLYFGMSGRVCQALGLGNNSSGWVESGIMSEEVALHRNWAYWSLFVTDVYWSLYVGRDFCLPDPEADVNEGRILLPPVNKEVDETSWWWSEPNFPEQPSRITGIFRATCELMKIGRRIMHLVNSGFRDYKLFTDIDLQLNAWKDRLPQELIITPSSRKYALPHLLVLHMAYWWLLSMLHRPFYLRRPTRSNSEPQMDHVKICNRAAQTTLSLLSTYDDLYSVRYIPSIVIQAMFSTGSIFILSAVRSLSGHRVADKILSESLSQADLCMKFLEKSSNSFENAGSIKGILENMTRMWVAPRMTLRHRDISISGENEGVPLPEEQDFADDTALVNAVPTEMDYSHQIPQSSANEEFFSFQDQMDTYSYFISGTSMLSNQNLPNQPFMTFTEDMNTSPLESYQIIDSNDFPVDMDTGLSAQGLMDELSRFWI